MQTDRGPSRWKEHAGFLGRRLKRPTGILRGHVVFQCGHAGLHRLLPLRATLAPLQELLGGTLDMADPEALP